MRAGRFAITGLIKLSLAATLVLVSMGSAATPPEPRGEEEDIPYRRSPIDNWNIVISGEICSMKAVFNNAGNTNLGIVVNERKSHILLIFFNRNWKSIVPDRRYSLRLLVRPGSQPEDVFGVGTSGADPEIRGLVLPFEGLDMGERVAKANGLALFLGSTFLTSVSLIGSAKAYQATKECAIEQLRKSNQDPFASEPAPPR